MPESAAGWRIEPPVSVPVAAGARRAATAAAEPPELPPGTRVAVPGIAHRAEVARSRSTSPSRTRPCWSCRAITAPARVEAARPRARRRARRSWRASSSRRWCASPCVQKMSLCAIGMPVSGCAVARARCARRRRAPARGCARRRRVMNAFSAGVEPRDALEEDAASARRWRACCARERRDSSVMVALMHRVRSR